MSRLQLQVQKRELTGKKVKQLRHEGILPANVYGSGVASLAIQLPVVTFQKTLREAGETDIIDLVIGGEKQSRPVLVNEVQISPVRGLPIHVDFFQVDLTKKVTVDVPIELVNDSPAVSQGKGMLLELMGEVEVESLPDRIPSAVEVDISNLNEVDDAITVGDLDVPEGVEVQAEPEELVVKIDQPARTLEEEEEIEAAKVEDDIEVEEDTDEEVGAEETVEEEGTEEA